MLANTISCKGLPGSHLPELHKDIGSVSLRAFEL